MNTQVKTQNSYFLSFKFSALPLHIWLYMPSHRLTTLPHVSASLWQPQTYPANRLMHSQCRNDWWSAAGIIFSERNIFLFDLSVDWMFNFLKEVKVSWCNDAICLGGARRKQTKYLAAQKFPPYCCPNFPYVHRTPIIIFLNWYTKDYNWGNDEIDKAYLKSSRDDFESKINTKLAPRDFRNTFS